jgi:mannose-1-phosphate guanylyltransferase / mannose-6-phosphate isomerase
MITPVILCGGAGTRLWPLSRKSLPKQFAPLIGDKSLLQTTLDRVALLRKQVVCISAQEHRFLVVEAMDAAQVTGTVILEPTARGTAAATLLAALGAPADSLLLFCPADHHIPDAQAFAAMVNAGVPAASAGAVVTFGVLPTFPSTGYGYIAKGAARGDGSFAVSRFIEKPALAAAQKMLLQDDVLWNAGIFLIKANALIDAFEKYAPDILQSCRAAHQAAQYEKMGQHDFVRPEPHSFSAIRSQSIDYAILEQHPQVAVVPFAGRWSDVGSWDAVAQLTAPDASGNRIVGRGVAIDTGNTYIHAPYRTVVALGLQDAVIVDTVDAVLIAHRDHVDNMKQVVERLEVLSHAESVLHRKITRPWGWSDTLDQGAHFEVKRVLVKPGCSLSLQVHRQRAEHWVVIKGTAKVTRDNEVIVLTQNQSMTIQIGQTHQLTNAGRDELEIIEVRSGTYLAEDDIERMKDTNGRD